MEYLTTSRVPSLGGDFDKFYTNDTTARACIGTLWREIRFRADDRFIEPSAGAGAFSRLLPAARLIALDIAPHAPGILTADFLAFTPPPHPGRSIAIGNPPFGRGGVLARKFINRASQFADIVAFILPASFSKPSMQRGINPQFHLLRQVELRDEAFHAGDRLHRVSCVFQIWTRRPEMRVAAIARTSHHDFRFVSDPADADVIIRRTGGHAGKLLPLLGRDHIKGHEPPFGYASNSNHYIRAVGCSAKDLHHRLSCLPLKIAAACAIQPCLGKADIVSLYERALEIPSEQHANDNAKLELCQSCHHAPAPRLKPRYVRNTGLPIYTFRSDETQRACGFRRGTPWVHKAPPDDGHTSRRVVQKRARPSRPPLPQPRPTVQWSNDIRAEYPGRDHNTRDQPDMAPGAFPRSHDVTGMRWQVPAVGRRLGWG